MGGATVAQYETISFEELYADVLDLMPSQPSAILDVGAGSGRDAAWLAGRGHSLVAVEPATGMREKTARRHTATGIQWMDDRLPGLERVHRTGMVFDLILLAAVWMHVLQPSDGPVPHIPKYARSGYVKANNLSK